MEKLKLSLSRSSLGEPSRSGNFGLCVLEALQVLSPQDDWWEILLLRLIVPINRSVHYNLRVILRLQLKIIEGLMPFTTYLYNDLLWEGRIFIKVDSWALLAELAVERLCEPVLGLILVVVDAKSSIKLLVLSAPVSLEELLFMVIPHLREFRKQFVFYSLSGSCFLRVNFLDCFLFLCLILRGNLVSCNLFNQSVISWEYFLVITSCFLKDQSVFELLVLSRLQGGETNRQEVAVVPETEVNLFQLFTIVQ